tara:strand:- start:56 stop:721 length:666 start_codon:yes stop_codon:yes gene_type:complete
MKIFVLSLKTKIGEDRRNKLNYPHDIVWGTDKLEEVPDYIKNNMKLLSTAKDKEKLLKQKSCHFYSYCRILEKIVEENIYDVIVCEDDAILKDKNLLNNLIEKKFNSPVILNSKLHHPKNYKNKLDLTKIKFKEDINEINYNEYRWSCSACIYYPNPESCKEILDFIKNTKLKYTYLDLFLSSNKKIKYLYYPSIFYIKDDGISQITDSKGNINDYGLNQM